MITKKTETFAKYNIAEDFWLRKLEGVAFRPFFGQGKNLVNIQRNTTTQWSLAFPSQLSAKVNTVTGGSNTRAFLIFLTTLNILVFKYTSENSILVTTTGFREETLEDRNDVLLFFRSVLTGDSTSRDLLNALLADLNEAYEHRRFQYESFFNRFINQNVGDKEALYAVGFMDEDFNMDSRLTEDIDVLFKIGLPGGELFLTLTYDTQCYRPDQIRQLGGHFLNCLASMLEDLDKSVYHINILSQEERRRLLVDFSGKTIDYQLHEKTFIPSFQDQVEKTPNHNAVVYEGNDFNYLELDENTNQLTRILLRKTSLQQEDLIAILMKRSEKMIQIIIAIWKCGAAYLPLDSDYPDDRIETIIHDSRVKLVISQSAVLRPGLAEKLKRLTNIIYLDEIKEIRNNKKHISHGIVLPPSGLAYVIYTSGSTGRPKGVMVEHRGMMNHLHAKLTEIQINSISVIAQNASHCFDISIWQFFAALLKGGQTIVYTNHLVLNPEEFIKQVGKNGITILEVVPSYLSMMLDIIDERKMGHLFPTLKYLLVTGETVRPALVKRWFEKFPGIKMVNAYGPTEASDDIAHFTMDDFSEDLRENIPIGRTVRNLRIYIMDNQGRLCPIGVKGEIYVSGIGVGRGYLNDIDKTRKAFMKDPFGDEAAVMMYRTGDMGRYKPDGNIEFFGRKDHQVKIRGYRIELEEIENKLSFIEGIRTAAVVDREDKTNNKYLCAYITLMDGIRENAEGIKRILRTWLPEYMIPSKIVFLQELPLTPNRKIDRKALPEPDGADISSLKYIAPRNAVEKKLAEIWQNVLGVGKIGIHDNFFNLGGDSFKGIRIINKIQDWLHEVVHVTVLFLAPTIAELALKLESYKKVDCETRMDAAKITEFRSIIQPLNPLPSHCKSSTKTPPVMFILCPSRSGSTLLRVILAGHPKLFAPQEFELLSFNTLKERKEALSGAFSLYLEGVIRAIMEIKQIDAEEAKMIMEEFESQEMTVQEFYGVLQGWLDGRLLVEKTPQYTYDIKILERAEEYFDSPLYIHLIRHPYAVIHSYENARLDQLFKYEHHFSSRQLGELLWLTCNQNILDFLENIPGNREFRLKYEDLVSNPEIFVSRMCNHFGLEFYPAMLDIYGDANKRMTDGIHAESKMLGDVKFFSHKSIDTESLEKWKEKYKTEFLGDAAIHLAKSFGYLQERIEYSGIEVTSEKDYYELSYAQKRLWILDQLEESHSAYNIPNVYLVEGDLNIGILKKSFETVVRRHEGLRTTFIKVDGIPTQKIRAFESIGFQLEYVDLRGQENPRKYTESLVNKEVAMTFDLAQGPLLKSKLLQLEEKKYVFLFILHHIISDGWSMRLLINDTLALYGAYKIDKGNPLPPLRIQYKDYSVWLHKNKMQGVLKKQEEYWLKEFEGEIPILNIPTDYLRPIHQSFEGRNTGFDLSVEETRALNKIADSEEASLFMVLLALFNIFLSKLSSQEDIVMGTPTAGRNHPDLEKVIGIFINTLVLRNYPLGEYSFTVFLRQVKKRTLDAFENQDYPFENLVEKITVKRDMGRNPVFDVTFTLLNIQEASILGGDITGTETAGLAIKPFPYENHTSKFDLSLSATEVGNRLFFTFQYCTKLFKEETILRFITYYKKIVSIAVKEPDLKLLQISIISEEEKNRILYDFNAIEVEYPVDKTIPQIFAEQVEQTPDNTAVIAPAMTGDIQLSYRELNEQSNRLAHVLQAKEVEPDTIVGIMVERSIEMITGIIGILKSGGAYMPIEPKYPQERIDYMLKDSGVKTLVSDRSDVETGHCPVLILDPVHASHGDIEIQNKSNSTGTGRSPVPTHASATGHRPLITSLAYVIYTSGSTGRPKGVLIRHQGVVNMVKYHYQVFGDNPGSRVSQVASASFDAMAFEVWPSLLAGAALCIADNETRLDSKAMKAWLIKKQITISFQSTQVAQLLLQEQWPETGVALKRLRAAGDRLTFYPTRSYPFHFYNLYGPTEDTVWTTWTQVPENPPGVETVKLPPLGKPVANKQVYILSQDLRLQPTAVGGELCIAGPGLARGYLNNPELTSEKFVIRPGHSSQFSRKDQYPMIDDRFSHYPITSLSQSPIYRTGDLARWLPDGNIEFLGRNDHQVKLRGFRIELGEIENCLLKITGLKEAVVVVREDEPGDKYLCAYIVSDREYGITELREFLSNELPGYMIPSYFVQMEKILLTSNGKIDRRALPGPAGISLRENVDYIPPVSDLEKKLVKIWGKVLGRDNIGINENFFMIGGDSIKSIQIISRMSSEGYKLEMKYLFQYPVISDLAPLVKKLKRIPDQAAITGTISLTPIQEAFFDEGHLAPHHYNQAVMFYSREGFDRETLKEVFSKIQEHHDALRMTYKLNLENNKIIQINHGLDYPLFLAEYDLRNWQNSLEELNVKLNEIQASIDLEKGPLMKLGLFHLDDGDRLLIVIHHLVIDGVSWRILFKDIETLYRQYNRGETLVLPSKTDSFKPWSEKLSIYANGPAFLKEKGYWTQMESNIVPGIPKDFYSEENKAQDTRSLSFSLGEEETGLLLTGVNHAFGTEINDILLTALGLGMKKTFGQDKVLLSLEGHGREEILEDMDISRTVGWFTSVYPVLLDISYAGDLGRQVKEIKEILRRIPNKGIGYGILKYLTAAEHKKEIEFKLKPQISFNYLGQFDADVNQMSFFEIARESVGNSVSMQNRREYELSVNSMISQDRLVVRVAYDNTHFKPETMASLVSNFQSELHQVIAFCSSKAKREFTPSDFTYKGLSIEAVNRLMRLYPDAEDIYTLTPMQEGMLFHTLVDERSYSYFEQVSYRLEGKLDIYLVEKSLNDLFKRHDILRTAFVYEDMERSLQVVLSKRAIDFYFEDIRETVGREAKEAFINEYKEKDKRRSFDLSKDVLMRVSILQVTNSEYEFTWSFHHILMDGWCGGILNTEFFEIYTAYLENRPYRLPVLKPYRMYIQWVERQDKEESIRYWQKYLDSIEEQTGVPKIKISKEGKIYRNQRVSVVLNMEQTAGLNKLAGRNHATLNTVTQTLWGILLCKYNGKEDVLFGAVVSGRPSELEGVESMVGLFINTIPVRIRFEEKMKFNRLLQKIQQEALASEPYHYHPLAEIQSLTALKQNLIDHLFIFENYPIVEQIEGYGNEKSGSDKTSLKLINVKVFEQTNYDFNFVLGGSDRLRLTFQYNGNLYDGDFVERISKHFCVAVDQVIANQELEVRELTLLSKEEKNLILNEFNNTEVDYPKDKTIHQLFEEQVEKIPDNTAVIGPSLLAIYRFIPQITYRELNVKANQLARLLAQKGVKTEAIVGVMAETSLELILAMLAVLKTGGAYLPISTGAPPERIKYMLKDSSANVLLTTAKLKDKAEVQENPGQLSELFLQYINIEMGLALPFEPSLLILNPTCRISSTNLAYIIYTSGSTGKPKGVMLQHRGINRLVKNANYINWGPGDKLLLTGAIAFDINTFEIWEPLLNGLTLVLVHRDDILNGEELAKITARHHITLLHLIPQLLNQVVELYPEIFARLNYFLVGGDLVQPHYVNKVRKINQNLKIIHMYGPTENTTFSTFFPVQREHDHAIPIGKPISNSTVYIINKFDQLVPIGAPGELVVGGDGVARGYLNNPELTFEKFCLRHPRTFWEKGSWTSKNFLSDHSTLYRTGDLARWLPDGDIEFLGRIDRQVKIRGFRIELGEIESQLLNHPFIKEAVVLASEDESRDKYLCAYIVSRMELMVSELREYLTKYIPDYMAPSHFVKIEKIPLTPNGKIDRRALPRPELKAGESYTAPRNEIEKKLIGLWTEVLARDAMHASQLQTSIGIDDNFFELGGHSLKAAILVSLIHKELNVRVPLAQVFRIPTIRELAQHIQGLTAEMFETIKFAEEREYYPLSSAQKGIFIQQKREIAMTAYNLSNILNLDFYIDKERLEGSFKKLIRRHGSLRTSFDLINNEPAQIVHTDVEFTIQYYDNVREEEIREIIRTFMKSFDLALPPLLRVGLIRREEDKSILLFVMHHIITDGVSYEIFQKEVVALYKGEELEPLRIHYKDYSLWQNSKKVQESITKQQEFWLAKYKDEIPSLKLPLDFERPSVKDFAGDRVALTVDNELTNRLKRLLEQTDTTLYMTLLAVYYILLSRYTNQEDIVVGSPVTGRSHADLHNIIGMFVNMLAIRNRLDRNKCFKDFLYEVKESVIDSMENQDYHFGELVTALGLQGDPSRNPLFDVVFAMQDPGNPKTAVREADYRAKPETQEPEVNSQSTYYGKEFNTVSFDLILAAFEGNGMTGMTFDYSTVLFRRATIEKMAEHFKDILRQVVENDRVRLCDILISHDLVEADSSVVGEDQEEFEF